MHTYILRTCTTYTLKFNIQTQLSLRPALHLTWALSFLPRCVYRVGAKYGAGPAAEEDIREPIKSLDRPFHRGPAQRNRGSTNVIPRYGVRSSKLRIDRAY